MNREDFPDFEENFYAKQYNATIIIESDYKCQESKFKEEIMMYR